jgi:F0F1-type ATP synthase epsilon subunit
MADLVLPFKLITPTGVLFDGPVLEVTAVNPMGEFGVLPQHINYITALVPCLVTVKVEHGQYRLFVVFGGLVEVKDGVMTILASTAENAEDLRGREALQGCRGRRGTAVSHQLLRTDLRKFGTVGAIGPRPPSRHPAPRHSALV